MDRQTTTTRRSRVRRRATPPKVRRAAARGGALDERPDWYKDAVIYEVHVRSFCDSDGDGIGDFEGLTEKLDYLQSLGVTAIWLLPFYPSPLRDDGYDIADYAGVHSDYGALRDFRRFVREAHNRGLRVITELVINHTSDQHPWFQRARQSPPGSNDRNFYVWSDTPTKYPNVRIIFQDTETSNWTWDSVAGQYFWHRFFSHQPDLNYDNPSVQEAVFKVMDRWFEMGVDGMRLDAVPYLFEREGTDCENLPETHAFLRKLRRRMDEKWPGRMLLAEANQWPEDAIEYFGDGDQCHMNFHFPLMPRLFMSVRMEDRLPIIDILNQTPPIPESCQWAMFLRNHDELTLEMVTDEERDYMYRSYARDKQMRINLGIRRRLAPLLDNDRRKIELMMALLCSMPGTPVLYYGDEIGMGDNVYLGDRDAVRTPMQWSGDRNAGFSRANPQKLFLPVIIDPGYHYETINVESQWTNPSSLLWWTKRLIALRKRHPVLARGDITFLHPDNHKVLAFLRHDGDSHLLVVANLSRFSQPCELNLSDFQGRTPVELFGNTAFPDIGELPYFLTLGPHTFHWFELRLKGAASGGRDAERAVVSTPMDPQTWFTGEGLVHWIEEELHRLLPMQRWFASKAKTIRSVAARAVLPIDPPSGEDVQFAIALTEIEYLGADPEMYQIPVALGAPERATRSFGAFGPALYAHVRDEDDMWSQTLYDATADEAFWRSMLALISERRSRSGVGGRVVGVGVKRKGRYLAPRNGELRPTLLAAEQSNSSAIFGDEAIMKLYRRLEPGMNPELELGSHLTTVARFNHTPQVVGSVHRRVEGQPDVTLAMAQRYVANEGDAWCFTLDVLGRFFDHVTTLSAEAGHEPPWIEGSLTERASRGFSDGDIEILNDFLHSVRLLGERTAEMHRALSQSNGHPDFEPEPYTRLHQRSLYQSMRNAVLRPFELLQKNSQELPERARDAAVEVLKSRQALMDRLRLVADKPIQAMRIRCHGDYHLGQVLWTGRDFIIIDFEGEPLRPLTERRLKRSPLMDVAGMLRSFQYAAFVGVRELVSRGVIDVGGSEYDRYTRWATYWKRLVESAFLGEYLNHIGDDLVPADREQIQVMLDAWLLQKAAYEVGYELNSRPDWAEIPLRGILEILRGDE